MTDARIEGGLLVVECECGTDTTLPLNDVATAFTSDAPNKYAICHECGSVYQPSEKLISSLADAMGIDR